MTRLLRKCAVLCCVLQVRTTAFPKVEAARQGGPAPIEAVPEEVLQAATAADTPKTTWIGGCVWGHEPCICWPAAAAAPSTPQCTVLQAIPW